MIQMSIVRPLARRNPELMAELRSGTQAALVVWGCLLGAALVAAYSFSLRFGRRSGAARPKARYAPLVISLIVLLCLAAVARVAFEQVRNSARSKRFALPTIFRSSLPST
jgi:TRAP-type C4-dicarboxylate transport system permease small subunit